MPLVATIHYPSLNPVGPAFLFALSVTVGLSLLSTARVNPSGWRKAVGVAPALLLVMAVGAAVTLTRFPDADDFAAVIVYIAFGFGFALASFRGYSLWHRISAVIFTTLHGALVVFWALEWLSVFLHALRPLPAAGAFAVGWLLVARWLYRKSARLARAHRGFCHVCGYDLRGSVASGRCPECGSPILFPDRVQPI